MRTKTLIALSILLFSELMYSQSSAKNELLYPEGNGCQVSFDPEIVITNKSSNKLLNLTLEVIINGTEKTSIQWSGSLVTEESGSLILPKFYVYEGIHTIQVYAKATDQNVGLDNINLKWATSFDFSGCTENASFVWGVQTTGKSTGQMSKDAFEKEGKKLEVKDTDKIYSCPNCNEKTTFPELNLWTHLFYSDRQLPETNISFNRGSDWQRGLWIPQNLEVEKDSIIYLATMEKEYSSFENLLFLELDKNRVVSEIGNQTTDERIITDEVARVETGRMGPSKILKIEPLESLSAKVQVYIEDFNNKKDSSAPSTLLVAALNSLQGGMSALEISPLSSSMPNFDNTLITGFLSENRSQKSGPTINFMLFDNNFEFIDGGFESLNKDEPSGYYTIKLPNLKFNISGYVFVFLTNLGSSDVYFDDFEIVHQMIRQN